MADPDAKVNRTDPDSRVVRDYWGYYQGYDVQAAATREQIVVAAELTRQATDVHELQSMVEAANAHLHELDQEPIGVLLAAAGYYSDANVQALAGTGPELPHASRSDRNRREAGPAPRGRPSAAGPHPRRTLATRTDAPHVDDQTRSPPLGTAPLGDRTGLRRHQGEPRHPPLPAPGFAACASEWKLIAATHKPAQALPPAPQSTVAPTLRPPTATAISSFP